jgi:hypothetical protein
LKSRAWKFCPRAGSGCALLGDGTLSLEDVECARGSDRAPKSRRNGRSSGISGLAEPVIAPLRRHALVDVGPIRNPVASGLLRIKDLDERSIKFMK